MVNLWYGRIVLMRVSTLADVPERYYAEVKAKLDAAGLDENGNPVVVADGE